jgi:hypothetical protein
LTARAYVNGTASPDRIDSTMVVDVQDLDPVNVPTRISGAMIG